MPNYDRMDDEQLMAAFYACDGRAFDALFGRWELPLRSFFLRRLPYWYLEREELALDLANETLAKVMLTKEGRGIARDVPARNAAPDVRPYRKALLQAIQGLPFATRFLIVAWEYALGTLDWNDSFYLLGAAPADRDNLRRQAGNDFRSCLDAAGQTVSAPSRARPEALTAPPAPPARPRARGPKAGQCRGIR